MLDSLTSWLATLNPALFYAALAWLLVKKFRRRTMDPGDSLPGGGG